MSLVRGGALGAHCQAQVVLGHGQVPGHGPRGPAPGPLGEPPERPGAGPAPVDALEALVEGLLRAVIRFADEAPQADRHGDDQGANDVDHLPPAGAVGPHRRPLAPRAQRRPVPAGYVHHPTPAGLVDGGEGVHVRPAQAQADTVTHGSGSSLQLFEQPKSAGQAHPRWWTLRCSGPRLSNPHSRGPVFRDWFSAASSSHDGHRWVPTGLFGSAPTGRRHLRPLGSPHSARPPSHTAGRLRWWTPLSKYRLLGRLLVVPPGSGTHEDPPIPVPRRGAANCGLTRLPPREPRPKETMRWRLSTPSGSRPAPGTTRTGPPLGAALPARRGTDRERG